MELAVDKLVYCGDSTNRVLAQTRNAVGIWNLETGALEKLVCENPRGGYINDVVVTSDGKYFGTAEGGFVSVWNLKNAIVLCRTRYVTGKPRWHLSTLHLGSVDHTN